jgi:hypothetical protein
MLSLNRTSTPPSLRLKHTAELSVGDPVIISPGAEIGMMRNQLALEAANRAQQAELAAAAAQRAQAAFNADLIRQQQAAAAKKLLDQLGAPTASTSSTPVFGAPAASNPRPVNGGPTSWGGFTAGTQLPATASGGGGRSEAGEFLLKNGTKIVWNGVRWVAKAARSVVFGRVGDVITAIEIFDWASGYLPQKPMPARIPTRYEFSGNIGMTYRHFDGSWQRFPPAGYNQYGAAMWGPKGPEAGAS